MEIQKEINQTARALKVILLAFATAVIMFAAVAFAVGPVMEPEAREGVEFLRWIAAGLPLLELAMAAQIWMVMGKSLEAAEDWRKRIAILRGRTIVVAALFEGPALLAGVVLLLLGPSWHVLPAIILFLLAIGALLPTPRRMQQAIGNDDGTRIDKYS